MTEARWLMPRAVTLDAAIGMSKWAVLVAVRRPGELGLIRRGRVPRCGGPDRAAHISPATPIGSSGDGRSGIGAVEIGDVRKPPIHAIATYRTRLRYNPSGASRAVKIASSTACSLGSLPLVCLAIVLAMVSDRRLPEAWESKVPRPHPVKVKPPPASSAAHGLLLCRQVETAPVQRSATPDSHETNAWASGGTAPTQPMYGTRPPRTLRA